MRKYLFFCLLLISVFSYAQPTISSFTPTSGSIGSTVTITGSNFNASTDHNIVFFGTVRGSVVAATENSLSVIVPAGAGNTPISVTTNGGLTGYSSNNFNVLFSNRDSIFRSTVFQKKITQADYTSPGPVFLKDLDGDGRPDCVVGLYFNKLSISINSLQSPRGVFSGKLDLESESSPQDIIAADFDGDGKPDIAVLNNDFSSTYNLSLYRNTGSGSGGILSFDSRIDYSLSRLSFNKIHYGDVDGDGKTDILISGYSDTLWIFRNTSVMGNISFAPRAAYNTTRYSANGDICLGDIDNDGKPDLVIRAYNQISVLKNKSTSGQILFDNPIGFPIMIVSTGQPIISDIDCDGKNDIVVLLSDSSRLSVLVNKGNQSRIAFSDPVYSSTSLKSFRVQCNDVDGDGRPDIIVENHSDNYLIDSLSIFRNLSLDGVVSFADKTSISLGAYIGGIQFGDINNDGKSDFVVSNPSNGAVSFWQNRINEPVLISITPQLVKTGDTVTIKGNNLTGVNSVSFGNTAAASFTVNNDNTITAIVGNGSSGFVKVVSAYGTDSFGSIRYNIPVIDSVSPIAAAVGSAVTISGKNFSSNATDNIVYFGAVKALVTGGNSNRLTVQVPNGATYRPVSITTKDGLIAYGTNNFITTFSNNDTVFRSTTFIKRAEQAGLGYPRSVLIQDINKDGKSDYVVVNQTANTLSVIRNNGQVGAAMFANKITLATDPTPVDAVSTDLDGDGKPDIAVLASAYNGFAGIDVYRNTTVSSGSISLDTKQSFASGLSILSKILYSDIDGDGKPDLIVGTYTDTVAIFRNTSSIGSISFAPAVYLKTFYTNGTISFGDLSGDGRPELVMGLYGQVAVFRNKSGVGNISFDNWVGYPVTNSSAVQPIITDIDGDGKNDIAFLIPNSNLVSIIRNTGSSSNLSFASETTYPTAINAYQILVSDIDGDGKPDLSILNHSSNNSDSLTVYRNRSVNGTISFGSRAITSIGQYISAVTAGDIDGDSKPDLLMLSQTNGTLFYLHNRISEPALVSITPDIVKTGDTVTIKGNNLTGVSSVTFGGTSAASFTVNNDSTITAVIGNGSSGFVKVVSVYGTDSLGSIRYNIPVIDSVSPIAAAVGSTVTISGKNFSSNATDNIVYFGAVKALVTGGNSNRLTVQVPNGATYRPVSITTQEGLIAYGTNNFITTFSNRDTIFHSTTFGKKINIGGYQNPSSIAIQDIDGDGKPDYVVVNQTGNSFSVTRNNRQSGSSTFSDKTSYPTDSTPLDAVSTDLDGDGKPDVVVLNLGQRSISVYKNNGLISGNISFGDRTNYEIGRTCFNIYYSDLDGDGKPDLIVSGNSTDTVSVFRNTSTIGNISFAGRQNLNVGFYSTSNLAFSDFNGDGRSEMILIGNNGQPSVHINTSVTGQISFGNRIVLSAPSGFNWYPLVSDFDNDGRNDIAVFTQSDNLNQVVVFQNISSQGVVSFTYVLNIQTGTGNGAMLAGDIDGDGHADLVILNHNNNSDNDSLAYYRNIGNGRAISFASRAVFSAGQNMSKIALGDFDGDSKPDLLITSSNNNMVTYLRNRISEPALISISPDLVKTGDTVTIKGNNLTGVNSVSFGGTSAASFTVNNDSTITAVIGNGSSGFVKVVSVYGTDSLGSIRYNIPVIDSVSPIAAAVGSTVTISGKNFSSNATDNIVYFGAVKALVTGGNSNRLTVQVPNGATYRPVSVTTREGLIAYGTNNFITIFSNRDTLFRSTTFIKRAEQTGFSNPSSVLIQDLDKDGKPDYVVVNQNSNTISVIRYNGKTGTAMFANKTTYSTDPTPVDVVSTDLDGDGKPDVAVLFSTYNGITGIDVYRNTNSSLGTISLDPKQSFESGGRSYGKIFYSDLDGDGKPDILIGTNQDTVAVFRNTSSVGAISFAPVVYIKTYYSNGNISIGDLNGDGKPELVMGGYYGQVSVYRNLSGPGSILFDSRISFPVTSSYTDQPIISDIDGDGKNDIAMLLPNSKLVSVIRNTSISSNLTFAAETTYPTGGNAFSNTFRILASDIDGDGKPDLSILNHSSSSSSDSLFIYKNTSVIGAISFASRAIANIGQYISAITAGDIDSDSKPDFLMTGSSAGTVLFLHNRISEPAISSAAPLTANTGDTLSIRGNNFTGVNSVTISKYPASSFIVISDTLIKAVVSSDGGNGSIAVTNNYGTDSISGFKKIGLPQIKSFTPTSTGNSKTVTIAGKNFTGTIQVSFGGVNAKSFIIRNDSTLSAIVNTGASGYVKVVNQTGADSLVGFIFVNPPKLSSFSPSAAAAGEMLTIKGINLSTASFVYFDSLGNSFASSILTGNDTMITRVQVPANANGGIIYVVTKGGYDSLFGFTLITKKPALKSATPLIVRPGDVISLKGNNLNSLLNVQLGDSTGINLSVTNDSIATVSVGFANSGNLKLLGNGGNDSIPGLVYISPPKIFDFTPVSAPVGATVSIKGKYFSQIPDSNIVFMGSVRAVVNHASDSLLTVTVPNGASLSPISVIANKLIAKSSNSFVPAFNANATINFGLYSFTKDSLSIRTGLNPQKPQLMDIDGDGKPDMVVLNRGNGSFSVFRNISTNRKLNFDGGANISVGTNSKYISVGDFDRDGKLDIALNQSTALVGGLDTLSLVRNNSTNGNIRFDNRVKSGTSGSSVDEGMAIADWDLDGKLDIGYPRISTALGQNGIMPFYLINLFTIKSDPFANSLASVLNLSPGIGSTIDRFSALLGNDLNEDGKTDLITLSKDSSSVFVLQNTIRTPSMSELTSGVYFRKKSYYVGSMPVSTLIQDLNRDKKPDIITLSTVTNDVSILKNISTSDSIYFDNKMDLSTIQNPISMAVADFNGDGKVDIVVANSNTLSLYRNTSSGASITFASPINFAMGQNISTIVAGDINLDGKPDIIITDTVSNTSTFWINQFDEPKILSLNPATVKWSDSVTVKGQNFLGVNNVKVGGLSVSSFRVLNDSTISFIPGNEVRTGAVKVTTVAGEDSIAGFVNQQKPVIQSFNPVKGLTGSLITIYGKNFAGVSTVSFGATAAYTITGISDTTIVALVAMGSSGKVTVSNTIGADSLDGFTFIPKPVISSFTPKDGKAGSAVTITGKYLSNVNAISFGGKSATNISVINDSVVTAIVADGASGYVRVTDNYYTDSLAGFTYLAKPKIISFSPLTGYEGSVITIKGTNLSTINTVGIGGNAALSVTIQSDSVITAIVGSGSSGFVTVAGKGGADSLSGFTYLAKPVISSFSPVTGVAGSVITIKGRNLNNTLSVTFGNIPATNVSITNDSVITAVVAAGKSGYVRISNTAGSDSLPGFSFVGKPILTSFTPKEGKSGTLVTITGKYLSNINAISFGGKSANNISVINDSVVTAIVADGVSGYVRVADNYYTDSLAGFTYLAKPKIISFSPLTGYEGSFITIKGANLSIINTVSIGGNAGLSVTSQSDSVITAVIGSVSSGFVTVAGKGGTDSLSGFTYITKPVISSFSPTTGVAGSVITLKGRNLSNTSSVTFGNTPAMSLNITSDSVITAIVGMGATGLVKIRNLAGSDSLNGFEYISKPVISLFSPATGVEGSVITIKGKNLLRLSSVLFGNVPVQKFDITNDTLITATLGQGSSGYVSVINMAGADSMNGFVFKKLPVINSFTPISGGFGSEVTISGINFLQANAVLFGGNPAGEFRVISDSIIKASVGKNGSGSVAVKNTDGDTSLNGFSFINPMIAISQPDGPLLFTYVNGGLFKTLRFQVAGKYMSDSIEIVAPGDFLISRSNVDQFQKSIKLPNNPSGIIDTTNIFVQYKGQTAIGNFSDSIVINSKMSSSIAIPTSVKLCDSTILFKPVVNNFSAGINCFKDSIALVISNDKGFSHYLWSTGDTAKSIRIKQSIQSLTVKVANQDGCYSENASPIELVQNNNPIPSIAMVTGNTLVSSSASNYRWYFNNTMVSGNTTEKLIPSKVGFYTVETSSDMVCWDRSTDYPVFAILTPLVNDSLTIKTYPNPTSTGLFYIVGSLQRATNVVAKVTVSDVNGNILLQTNKFIFFGKEIKIPVRLSVKGTVFAKIDINGDIKTQIVILQ